MFILRPLVPAILIVPALSLLAGCSKSAEGADTTGSLPSNFKGSLVTASFPSAPVALEATDETGAAVRAAIGKDGSFQLALTKGHSYRIQVVLGAGAEPLVFPRTAAKLDRSFRVSSGAASVDLGAVRHLAAAPAGGFVATTQDGECEDGKDTKTGAACVDDEGAMSCEGARSAAAPDGECEGGKDTKTGAACIDPDEDQADPTMPMALPEHNAPQDVGGCEDGLPDGETNDD